MDWDAVALNLTVGILAEVIAAALVGAAAFFLAKLVLSMPSIEGPWTVTVKCNASTYRPYIGLEMTYIVLLSQRGDAVEGTCEKVFERRADGSTHNYQGEYRTRGRVSGGLRSSRLISKDISIHVTENGRRREYSSVHVLKESSSGLKGTFSSTAANSSGTSVWSRGIRDYDFYNRL